MTIEDRTIAATAPSEPKISPTEAHHLYSDRNSRLTYEKPSFLFRYVVYQAYRLDRFFVRLTTLLASPSSTDALLGTLSYVLELVAVLLPHFFAYRNVSPTPTIVAKGDNALMPKETLLATLPTHPSDEVLAQVATGSKALAGVIADYRVFVRLWGLANLYMLTRRTWNTPIAKEDGTKAKVVRRIVWAQITGLVFYYILENGAYLASKGVLTGSGWSGVDGQKREMSWWIWSNRFWALQVSLELVRVGVLQYYDGQKSNTGREMIITDGEKEGKLLVEQKKREHREWWRDAVSNVAYMPMTLQFSVEEENRMLSDWGVGVLGAVAGSSLLVDAWRKTA